MARADVIAALPFVDTHAHLENIIGGRRADSQDFRQAAEAAVATLATAGLQRIVLMPHPQATADTGKAYDIEDLRDATKKQADQFSFLGGGGSLLHMIYRTQPGEVTDEIRERFRKRAVEIIKQGAVGFGEMSFLHFSAHEKHAYHAIPADHPLYLLLADIAAEHNIIIDLHGEALTHDQPTPPLVRKRSTNNPSSVQANLAGLERLLAHNRQARIVWVHAGWDLVGERTVELTHRMLRAHPNLYLSIKIVPYQSTLVVTSNRPDQEDGTVRPEWVELMRAFPDRFVIGTDQFFAGSDVTDSEVRFKGARKRVRLSRRFLNSLPTDLARKVGYENAVRIYRLPTAFPEL